MSRRAFRHVCYVRTQIPLNAPRHAVNAPGRDRAGIRIPAGRPSLRAGRPPGRRRRPRDRNRAPRSASRQRPTSGGARPRDDQQDGEGAHRDDRDGDQHDPVRRGPAGLPRPHAHRQAEGCARAGALDTPRTARAASPAAARADRRRRCAAIRCCCACRAQHGQGNRLPPGSSTAIPSACPSPGVTCSGTGAAAAMGERRR